MRRKGNEVCPSFLSQLSHLLSLTHSLSYIVSSLVRTWVSWKCLDFDIEPRGYQWIQKIRTIPSAI
jgi:hypothetical protein